ncbi:MAG: HAD family hydrolase [Patescibacteria group bacterium]|nr:HAD family hydrolase [Patescibacteria group bacterium]
MIHPPLIKFVGLDLDLTLYKENKKVEEAFRNAWYTLMASEFEISYQEAKKKFLEYRKTITGGCAIARAMGIKDPENFAMRASTKAKTHLYLKKDQRLVDLIKYLQEKYVLFLVTASAKADAYLKLKKLGIDPKNDFQYKIFGDSEKSGKFNGKSFSKLIKMTKGKPREHLFVGDKEAQDIIPAKRAGMQTVMVWKQSKNADLSLPTIYDLEKWL